MTKEENLHWIDEEIRAWENECQSKHPIKEALYAARKALEQEQDKPMVEIDLYSVIKQKYIERDVLDKIRAKIKAMSGDIETIADALAIIDKLREEIMKLDDINPYYPMDRTIHISRNEVLQIIDKCKAESEVSE